ncbi:MAG: hypothetical protein ACK5VR_07325 [Burkholderiales bacterium]
MSRPSTAKAKGEASAVPAPPYLRYYAASARPRPTTSRIRSRSASSARLIGESPRTNYASPTTN